VVTDPTNECTVSTGQGLPAVSTRGAFSQVRQGRDGEHVVKGTTAALEEGLVGVGSLLGALQGAAQLSDVGAVMWILVRHVVPCDTMALFLPDEAQERVVVRFAAGMHAQALRGVTRPADAGVAGWVAVNRKPVLNAEAALDLGQRAAAAPALRSSLVVPLIESDAVVAVLAVYSTELLAFSDDHARILELLGPGLASASLDAVIADEDRAATPRPPLRLIKGSGL
jgi:GAF domain-containing protein